MTSKYYQVFKSDIVDALTSTAADKPLSANQGRVLNSKVTHGTAAPSAAGNAGDLYVKLPNIPAGYITIGTPQELVDFATRVNNGETKLKACITSDLDMSGVSWSGIGNSSYNFAGVFNGYGHSISNLTSACLFYDTGAATISNLGMKNCSIDVVSAKDSGGVLIRRAYGTTVTNCFSSDCTMKGWANLSGLIGLSYNSTKVSNCYCYNNTISASYAYASGLICFVRDTAVSNCAIYGGTHGDTLFNNSTGTVTNCYTSASTGVTSDVFHTKGFWDGTGVSGTTYLSWDFTDTWEWDSETTLPKLKITSVDTELYTYNGSVWVKIGSSEEA